MEYGYVVMEQFFFEFVANDPNSISTLSSSSIRAGSSKSELAKISELRNKWIKNL